MFLCICLKCYNKFLWLTNSFFIILINLEIIFVVFKITIKTINLIFSKRFKIYFFRIYIKISIESKKWSNLLPRLLTIYSIRYFLPKNNVRRYHCKYSIGLFYSLRWFSSFLYKLFIFFIIDSFYKRILSG